MVLRTEVKKWFPPWKAQPARHSTAIYKTFAIRDDFIWKRKKFRVEEDAPRYRIYVTKLRIEIHPVTVQRDHLAPFIAVPRSKKFEKIGIDDILARKVIIPV